MDQVISALRLSKEKTVTRGGKCLLARPPSLQTAASFSHADWSIRTTAQGAVMLAMVPTAGWSSILLRHLPQGMAGQGLVGLALPSGLSLLSDQELLAPPV